LGILIAWEKFSLKKAGGLEISGDLAVHKFNKEKSKFANYLGEIRVPLRAPTPQVRYAKYPSAAAFLRAKNFGIAQNYKYASSLLLLSYRVSLFPWVRSESTEDLWLPGSSGEFPTGVKRLRSARDGG
jgi:hypothetical protein